MRKHVTLSVHSIYFREELKLLDTILAILQRLLFASHDPLRHRTGPLR